MYETMIPIKGDLQLCVEAGGNPQNPPIILIMGLGSQMVFWPNSFIQRLIQAGFFVIRFDNRDIGLSSKIYRDDIKISKSNLIQMMLRLQTGLSNRHTKVAYHLTDLAEDTAQLIQALDLGKVHLIGASMGGMIAQILAAQYPHLIQRMGLLFTTNNHPFLPTPKPKQLYTFFKKPDSLNQEDVIRHSLWFMETVGSPGHINIQQTNHIAKIRYQRNFYPRGTVQQLHAILATGAITHYSRQVTAPTLILHGSQDGLLPLSHGRRVARDIPNAQFQLIDGMGHDIPAYYQPFIVQKLAQHFASSI
ncbi:alpha/beta fold hydrolase [Psychrobacter sp. I-STPA6b]|uniref:alpha/beta fold hydrolase n=1 Tax=Psychrobacter sp. I-STPA6b TaxID=2585718 RepID=UPI001D0C6A62|nr:alpha/beta hydrolase [Psychrobacter sp. I-STPA6b]